MYSTCTSYSMNNWGTTFYSFLNRSFHFDTFSYIHLVYRNQQYKTESFWCLSLFLSIPTSMFIISWIQNSRIYSRPSLYSRSFCGSHFKHNGAVKDSICVYSEPYSGGCERRGANTLCFEWKSWKVMRNVLDELAKKKPEIIWFRWSINLKHSWDMYA